MDQLDPKRTILELQSSDAVPAYSSSIVFKGAILYFGDKSHVIYFIQLKKKKDFIPNSLQWNVIPQSEEKAIQCEFKNIRQILNMAGGDKFRLKINT